MLGTSAGRKNWTDLGPRSAVGWADASATALFSFFFCYSLCATMDHHQAPPVAPRSSSTEVRSQFRPDLWIYWKFSHQFISEGLHRLHRQLRGFILTLVLWHPKISCSDWAPPPPVPDDSLPLGEEEAPPVPEPTDEEIVAEVLAWRYFLPINFS